MTRVAGLVAASLAALTVGCGGGEPRAVVIVPAPVLVPAAVAAPRAPRSYRDLGAPMAIDQRQEGVGTAAFSPDGALAAITLGDPAGLGLFDVDRRARVGWAALPAGRTHLVDHGFAPGGDLLAVVSRSPLDSAVATARYDGRTGALRGVAEGDLRGFVVVNGAARYVVLNEAAGRIELRALSTPEPDPVVIPLPAGTDRVLVAVNGVLVLGTQASVHALDASGKEIWSRPTPLSNGIAASAEASALLEKIDGERVRVTDLRTGKERQTIAGARMYTATGGTLANTDLDAAPFVTSNVDGRFAIVGVGSAPRAPLVLGPPPRAFGVAPGGRFAVSVAPSGEVSLVDVARDLVRVVGDVGAAPVPQVSVSGDGALVGLVAREPGRDPITRVLRGGREELTLPGACAFASDAAGAARLATCEGGRWFDLSASARPASSAPSGPPPARNVVFDDSATPAFTARCAAAGATAALGAAGARGQALLKGSSTWQAVGASGLAVDDAGGVDVWDVAAARLRGHVAVDATSSFPHALSANGALLAVAKYNGVAVDLLRVADGALVRRIALRAAVTTLGFHGDEELVVATAKQAQGCCWNESPTPRQTYPHGGKITVFDVRNGRALRAFAGEGFVLDATGSTIGITAPGHAAVLDAATGKTIAALPGPGRLTELSPSGRFAVIEETREEPGDVVTRVVELPSGRERFAMRGASAGVAFDPHDARVALAPVPMAVAPGEAFAQALTVYDLARDKREDLALAEPGAQPFFARGGAVLGYETAGGLGFVRLADGRALAVRGFERGGACKLYAATADGAFTGSAEGGLGIRLGDDLAASELLVSGARFEAHRRDDLLASFFDGR